MLDVVTELLGFAGIVQLYRKMEGGCSLLSHFNCRLSLLRASLKSHSFDKRIFHIYMYISLLSSRHIIC